MHPPVPSASQRAPCRASLPIADGPHGQDSVMVSRVTDLQLSNASSSDCRSLGPALTALLFLRVRGDFPSGLSSGVHIKTPEGPQCSEGLTGARALFQDGDSGPVAEGLSFPTAWQLVFPSAGDSRESKKADCRLHLQFTHHYFHLILVSDTSH